LVSGNGVPIIKPHCPYQYITYNKYIFVPVRDFAAAKKIGAPGLHGRSWPDLDMLPLGWLTDPGNAICYGEVEFDNIL